MVWYRCTWAASPYLCLKTIPVAYVVLHGMHVCEALGKRSSKLMKISIAKMASPENTSV
jgi:hypothetical protein